MLAAPPSGDPPAGSHLKVKSARCFKLDAKSIPEALATTFRILLKFSIVLAHRQNPARELSIDLVHQTSGDLGPPHEALRPPALVPRYSREGAPGLP